MKPAWRRLTPAWAVALLLALAGHVWLVDTLRDALQSPSLMAPAIQRTAVRFDRVLAPAAPVQVQAAPPHVAPRRVASRSEAPKAPAPSASSAADANPDMVAAEQAASAAVEPRRAEAELAASAAASAVAAAASAEQAAAAARAASEMAAQATASAAASASVSSSASASTADRPGLPEFTWPASTRLSYRLTGWYRGEVHGQAEVEWLRVDAQRYQVHLSVTVGPSFAPLMTRRMSSEGRITPDGLAPQRYEQLTTQIIGRDRQLTMAFGPAGIRLARGESVPFQADVQDTASQFIQIIYLLRTRPELAQKGQAMAFALALPNRVDPWVYEVAEQVVEQTPVGPLETLHVKPRRRAEGGNLTAQMWYAPALQMLPVRIRIEQDAQTWVDLRLEKAPEQGG
ncbi:DUF3108 domain-containing protein [Sphaerotilus mobilis]|uniref:Uncharacterized protein DUF3108 n=1 Tax=Sphaerotilus mobilis TaxID=47994 RepID=A0A4Q7LIU5_9BURK|nr:DUF3108 domain-containing protein [Sphaerotilus mobilis]RZS54406.1 uncharacterized protein DUF3108 [Sphaerotilus mobilis]